MFKVFVSFWRARFQNRHTRDCHIPWETAKLEICINFETLAVCRSHILAFEGDSTVRWYEGSYSEYEADLRSRNGNKDPTRVKFRKLATATMA